MNVAFPWMVLSTRILERIAHLANSTVLPLGSF